MSEAISEPTITQHVTSQPAIEVIKTRICSHVGVAASMMWNLGKAGSTSDHVKTSENLLATLHKLDELTEVLRIITGEQTIITPDDSTT